MRDFSYNKSRKRHRRRIPLCIAYWWSAAGRLAALTSILGASLGRRRKISVTLLDRSRIHVWKPLLHEIASGAMDSEADLIELMAHARRRHYRYRMAK